MNRYDRSARFRELVAACDLEMGEILIVETGSTAGLVHTLRFQPAMVVDPFSYHEEPKTNQPYWRQFEKKRFK